MGDAVVAQTEVVAAGGFRITIAPDELTATADKSAWLPQKKSAGRTTFRAILWIFFGLAVLIRLADGSSSAKAVVLVMVFGLALLWRYLRGTRNLHCTRANLEVIVTVRGKVKNKWLFPKELVKQIHFGPVAYSRYGSTCGLIFEAQGKKVKILRGLECPEAQRILRELDRLGFDVVHDVGMPMMVEMVLERRNSWLS